MTYGSVQVCELIGVTPRKLQWWDEQGLVSPVQRGHRRVYSLYEVVMVALIVDLKKKGLTLGAVRTVLHWLRIEEVESAIKGRRRLYVMWDGTKPSIERDHVAVGKRLCAAPGAMVAVCVSKHIEKIRKAEMP